MDIITALAKATAPRAAKGSGATATAPIIIRPGSSPAKPREWNEDAAVAGGFKGNVWVSAALRRKATAAARVPLVVNVLQGEEWEPAASAKGEAGVKARELYRLLERPNPKMSRADFIGRCLILMDLTGNFLAHKVGRGTRALDSDQPVIALWPLPAGFRPVLDDTGYADGFKNQKLNRGRKEYPAAEVLHLLYPDPSNHGWGCSPLEAAAAVVDADNEAMKWNREAMLNRAVKDVLLTTPGFPNPDQYAAVRQLVDEQMQGARNARGVALLPGDWTASDLDRSPLEMDFIESQKLSIQKIAAAFGVPIPLLSTEVQTYSNYREAMRDLWVNAVIPWLDLVIDGLNRDLVPHFGDPEALWITYDLSNVEALREDQDKKATTLGRYLRAGVPYNVAIELLDIDVPPIPGAGDIPHGVSLSYALASLRQEALPPAIDVTPEPEKRREAPSLKLSAPSEAKFAHLSELAPLWTLADRTGDAVASAFRRISAEVRQRVDLEQLMAALTSGSPTDVIQALGVERLRVDLAGMVPVVGSGARTAMESAQARLSTRAGREIRIDEAVAGRYAAAATGTAVDFIGNSTARGISESLAILRAAEATGSGLSEIARLFLLMGSVNGDQAAQASRFLVDLLASGAALDSAMGKVEKLLERAVAQRAATIGGDLGPRAAWGGQRAAFDYARETAQVRDVRRIWIDADDSKVCVECISLDEQTVGNDELYISPISGSSYYGPPEPHPGSCRCGEGLAEVVT